MIKKTLKNPPSSVVQNFLVIPVVVSVWMKDVNDGSRGPKRLVYIKNICFGFKKFGLVLNSET